MVSFISLGHNHTKKDKLLKTLEILLYIIIGINFVALFFLLILERLGIQVVIVHKITFICLGFLVYGFLLKLLLDLTIGKSTDRIIFAINVWAFETFSIFGVIYFILSSAYLGYHQIVLNYGTIIILLVMILLGLFTSRLLYIKWLTLYPHERRALIVHLIFAESFFLLLLLALLGFSKPLLKQIAEILPTALLFLEYIVIRRKR